MTRSCPTEQGDPNWEPLGAPDVIAADKAKVKADLELIKQDAAAKSTKK